MASDNETFFYDLKNQENVYLSDGTWGEFDERLADLIDSEPERFLRLPDQRDIHEYRFMEAFVYISQDITE